MSDVLDNYIPLKRIKVLDGECVGDVWEGVGNRVFEMPDCPANFRQRVEDGYMVFVESMSAIYAKRKC